MATPNTTSPGDKCLRQGPQAARLDQRLDTPRSAQIGLYFTDVPPTNTTLVFTLNSLNIDIPRGTNHWLIKDQFTMPVDADVLAVLPHTHYLGKRLEGIARFADGHTHSMLLITNWDFNWQGDYRYARPVHLPAGNAGNEIRFRQLGR